MERSHQDNQLGLEDGPTPGQTPETEGSLKYTGVGAIPQVANGLELASLSASDLAYGGKGKTAGKGNDEDSTDELSPKGRIMAGIAERDGNAIEEASKKYGVPETDILAVITQESQGVATANAGKHQKDKGAHAASGLMQVTEGTWKSTVARHSELAKYSFSGYRYDRRINILVGTAALRDKREALEDLGVQVNGPSATALTIMAFNAGEGIVSAAYHAAVESGEKNPAGACLEAQYLKPAIAKYPSVYSYYLTGGGKKKNPQRSKQRAIDLKFLEISKYPHEVQMLVAEANEHEMAEKDDSDMAPPVMTAEAEHDRSTQSG